MGISRLTPIDTTGAGAANQGVTLESRPERRLIRNSGSHRHIDFSIRVKDALPQARPQRAPLTIALVLDRSGSMAGDKLPTAKRAALAVLDRLDERDEVAVVVFDSTVDVLQPAATATDKTKQRIRQALARIEARASTALYEGWLTGCQAIASDGAGPRPDAVARCFLLTDGQANVGVIDPEEIASAAAGIRERAGIGTSTFGIGRDYNESLLGPMAVAGSGQFHHLRSAEEIVNTFVGELGEMLAVAASKVRLELDGGSDITAEVISSYRASQPLPGTSRVTVPIGDLMAGEERHVIVRFGFPAHGELSERRIVARMLWSAGGVEYATPWQETRFTYADHAACDAERQSGMDGAVMHWVGLHHAERAKRVATDLNRRGDYEGARQTAEGVRRRIAEYASADADLRQAGAELESFGRQVHAAPLSEDVAKETHFRCPSPVSRAEGPP